MTDDSTRTQPRRTESTQALAAVQSIVEGIITVDSKRLIVFMNYAATVLTGWSVADAMGQPVDSVFKIIVPETNEALDPIQATLEEGKVYSLLPHSMLIRRDTSELPIEDSIAPIRDTAGRVIGATILFRDVRTTHGILLRAIQQANHDALTGLPNRVLLQDRLARALAQLRRKQSLAAVLFLDIDSFKNVNDSYGHAMGDSCLKQLSQRVIGSVRASDTVSRLSGDEFVVLLPDLANIQEAMMIAKKILATARTPFSLSGVVIQVSISIGVAVCTSYDYPVATLLADADAAMYRAKHKGGNGIEVSTTLE